MDTVAVSVHEAPGSFRLSSASRGRFTAAGPLTFATATAACADGLQKLAIPDGGDLEIDCAGVSASDSAGLAVLVEWLGAARRAGHKLRYARLPEGLLALARISEVEELLERGV